MSTSVVVSLPQNSDKEISRDSEAPSLNNYNNSSDLVDDARSQGTASSLGFGSIADFQSQAELCPSHIMKDKQSGLGEDVEKCPKEKGQKKEYTGIKRYAGLILTLMASVFFSFVTLMVKILTDDYGNDAYSSSFWRYAGITLPAIPILMFYEWGPGGREMRDKGLKETGKNGSLFDTVWPIHENIWTWIGLLGRGLVASTSVILRYYALQYLSLGDTSVITYSTPVLVTVMAHFFLGEKCGVVPVLVAFSTLMGVVLVARPPLLTGEESFDTGTLIGTALACGSLFCSSLIVIITRKIREVHFGLMVLVFGAVGVAQSVILAYTLGHGEVDVPIGLRDSLLTAGVAVLSFLGQMSIILALKFEQAGPVALIRSCDVVFGFLLQYVFLDVAPDKWSSVGGVVVFVGVVIIAIRKWISTFPEESNIRKSFLGCVLR